MKITASKNRSNKRAAILLAAILVLGLALSVSFFYGPSIINTSDNYLYTDSAHNLLSGNFNSITGPLDERYILISGIALFYLLFGYSPASAAAFGVLCFLSTIVLIYLIGKELYSNEAGLIAAFLYSFFPLAVIESSNVGDNIPMAFFATLSVLLAIKASMPEERHSGIYFALTGFFMVASFLVTSETVIIIPVVIFVFLANYEKIKKNIRASAIYFMAGILVAVWLIATLGAAKTGNPLSLVASSSSFYSQSFIYNHNSFSSYMMAIFPYDITGRLKLMLMGNATPMLSIFETMPMHFEPDYDFFGLFGYAVAIFIIVLAIIPKRRSSIPLFWFAFVLLYLSFGTASLTKYVFLITWPRFLLLLAPAAMLIIAFGFLTLLEKLGSHSIARLLVELLFTVMIVALFANAVMTIRTMAYSQYKYVYPLVNVGNFLISRYSADPNITVYDDFGFPIGIYYKYKTQIYGIPPQCCQIMGNALVVEYNNSQIIKECNLTLEYKPPAPPAWLGGYDELDYIGGGMYNVSVYLMPQHVNCS